MLYYLEIGDSTQKLELLKRSLKIRMNFKFC